MVDIGPIKQQIDEISKQHKLSPELEKKIKRFLSTARTITERQANILQSIINDAVNGIKSTASIEELNVMVTSNIFETQKAQQKLIDYQNNIGKMFLAGMALGIFDSRSKLVTQMKDTVIQSSMNYVKQLGERYKVESSNLVRQLANKGYTNQDMSRIVQGFYKKKAWEADRIVRTETMRAGNIGAYSQARREGATHYAIDGRAEFCSFCRSISKRGPYPIDDINHIPPLHPNCACVAVFFRDEAEAIKDQDYLNKQIDLQRAALEKKGYTIPNDGTGAEVNKIKPEERIHN